MSVHSEERTIDPFDTLDRRDRESARFITLKYVLSAHAILLVSGLMGIVIHDSQADVGRINGTMWYALMTAHGIAASWAGARSP